MRFSLFLLEFVKVFGGLKWVCYAPIYKNFGHASFVLWGIFHHCGMVWLTRLVMARSLFVVSSFDFFDRRSFRRMSLDVLCLNLIMDFQSITYPNTAPQNEMFGGL